MTDGDIVDTDRPVQFTDAAADDLRRLAGRNRVVLLEVLRQLKLLARGRIDPQPLRHFGKTGDLGDCGKIVVALEGEPEYRIVVRDPNDDGTFTVCEVVVIEDRTDDLPYLLAGVRLERIDDPHRRSMAQRRISRIRSLWSGGS